MLPLLRAIYNKFTGTSAVTTAFPGGYHRDQAPEGAFTSGSTSIYLVSSVVAAPDEAQYGTAFIGDVDIRFSAFGVGHDTVGAAMQTWIDTLDASAALTLTSGQNTNIVRMGKMLPVLDTTDADGNDVWQWTVVYRFSTR